MKSRSPLETETAALFRAGTGTGGGSLSSSTSSSTGGGDETTGRPRRDEDEALLRTELTASRDRPSSSRGSSGAGANDDDGDQAASSSGTSGHPPELPLPLRILFGCNGITLALPSTALMYIVNTRIAVPLSVLPAYASVAFLPFSLKPLYAVATHCLDPSQPPTTLLPRSPRRRRHVLLSFLLLLNSATIFGTYYAKDVPSCFVWAFLRGITSAWAEFLLGLALLSHVGGGGNRQRAEDEEEEEGEDDGIRRTSLADVDGGTAANVTSFRASRFQAEAAAARSAGSLVAYAFTATYFGLGALAKKKTGGSNGSEGSRAISESDVWNLLAVAALVHVAGSALALASRVGSSEPEPSKPSEDEEPSSDDGPGVGCLGRIQALWRAAAAKLTTSRDPSYHRVGAGSEVDRPIDESDNQEEVTIVESDRQPLDAASSSTSSFSIAATLMVGSLQVALVLMTVRQPIVGATSAGAWWCGWIACVVALVGSAVRYSSIRGGGVGGNTAALSRRRSNPDTTSHRVGLFLMLRHAVPNCGYLVGSYVYTLLEEHPVVLQVLAVHGSAVTTVAAWSYGRFGASSFSNIPANAQPSPRNDPRPRHQFYHAVIPVIVITTIAASLISLTQLSYVYYVVPPPMVSIIVPQLGLIFLVKSLTTLADEWKFLPDVVLATLAAVEDDEGVSPEIQTPDVDAVSTCSLPRRDGESNVEARGSGPHSLERDLKYGSLISCIDFGEQLGSLLTGPLVAVLHVTRDGAQGRWVHFDRLIIVGALLSVMSLFLLLILPGVNLSTICRVHLLSSGYTNRQS